MSSIPALGNLRIATQADVLRISIVAVAAFVFSPVFKWERPYHKEYPKDTLLSYRSLFEDAVRSDDYIVLVAEDDYVSSENDHTIATIPDDHDWPAPAPGEGIKVVVGFISIKLEPESPHRGKFTDGKGSSPRKRSQSLGRDLNHRHYDNWAALSTSVREKNNVLNDSTISMLAVHAAYWRRGHGRRLATWAKSLAMNDRVPQCVSATSMSQPLFESLGFQKLDEIEASGDNDDPEGARTCLLEFGGEYRE
ncbi:hypothetical protein B0T21DRAFT_93333 [Apiosordaria backusii]|uniref:N-acetyltransferase domain-containing protein n=1 Tax=Apiosordaria backusii TaxID=314023 RepID=A0AA40ESP6_9PEZI|nr:hypothetical protein B0T21DRAFT_93333 [Apiosordaria backusii]